MSVCFSRNKLFDIITLGLFCLMLSACQAPDEHVTELHSLDPKIVVIEPPPKPLPDDLVINDTPLPLQQNTPVSIPTIKGEDVPLKLVSQPPAILPPSVVQPVGFNPKRSALQVALEAYLDHRTDDAIAALKHYSTNDQDMMLVMLPMLASIEQGDAWAKLDGPQKMAKLESLRNLITQLSKSAPLKLQHVAFVDEPPIRFGEIKPRSSLNFYPQEYVYIYAEVLNLIDSLNSDEDYDVRLNVSIELVSANGTVYWNRSKAFDRLSSVTARNDHHVTAQFSLPKNLAPGSYQVVLHVLDRDTNRTDHKVLPLQILDSHVKPAAAAKRKG